MTTELSPLQETNRLINAAKLNPHAVVGLEVDGLFEQFTYSTHAAKENEAKCQKLLVLYGDNGSGKTTLLNLIQHLLSPEPKSGHRTAIGKVVFKLLSVHLADGTQVQATRPAASRGSYSLRIIRTDGASTEIFVNANEQGEIDLTDQQREALRHFESELASVGTTAYFLKDDRQLNDGSNKAARRRRELRMPDGTATFISLPQDEFTFEGIPATNESNPITAALIKAAESLKQHLRKELSERMREGDNSANGIYENVVRRIIFAADSANDSDSQGDIAEKLRQIAAALESAKAYRIGSPAPILRMAELIDQAPPNRARILQDVLGPYIDGLGARTNGLVTSIARFETLAGTINKEFFKGKRARIDADDGLRVESRNGQHIPLAALSSGERQLLLILIRATLLGGSHEIFIIDEPEISLNVKWQRRLIPALLRCTEDSPVQVILASHSLQMLSAFQEHVIRLG